VGITSVGILSGALGEEALTEPLLRQLSQLPALAPYVRIYEVAPDYASTQADVRATRRETLTALLQSVGVEATAIHVVEGRAADVICGLAAELSAGLTVVGTAARTGLKKLLIGNTAESIISDLSTDLLTIRARKVVRARKRG
jgi:nucleotide-binding universal stress UspA family protein